MPNEDSATSAVAEQRLAREAGDHFADDAHAGQDHDVDGRVAVEPEQVLEQQRIAAQRRVEDADAEDALDHFEGQRHRQHGNGEQEDEAGGIDGPDEDRQPPPRQARRAQAVDGDDEVQAGEDRGKAGDHDADEHEVHVAVGGCASVRRVERPAGIDAAEQHAEQRPARRRTEQVPARQVDARKREVLGTDHQRQAEVAQHGRHHRHEEEKHHDDAVQREQPVVGVGVDQAALGHHQVEPDDGDREAADEEHHRHRREVEQGDALVVLGQEPRHQAGGDIQIRGRAARGGWGASIRGSRMAVLMASCPWVPRSAAWQPAADTPRRAAASGRASGRG